MLDVSSKDITEGSLGRALAFLSVPIVAQQLALVAQQVIDVFWIGRLGEDQVAAVGLVMPLLGLFAAGTMAVFLGGQIVVSQRVGADDLPGSRRAAFHALVGAGVVGLLLAGVVNAFALDITQLFQPGDRVAQLGAIYLGTMVLSYTFSGMSDAMEAAFVGSGDSRTPLVVNLVAIVVNVVLDPILMFGMWRFDAYGIAGAAYATLVAYAVGLLIALGVALSGRGGFTLTRNAVGIDVDEFRALLDVGAPKAAQESGRQIARLVMVSIISVTGGGAALAAYTVGARISTVAFVPAIGLGSAGTTLVGQNLGADRPDRATRATWLGVGVGAVGVGVLGIVQWFVPGFLAEVFVPGIEGETLEYTIAYLQILALGYWALGAIYTVEAGFNGAGRTSISMYSTMLQYWTVRIPVAAVLAFGLGYGAHGPFWAVTVSNVVAAVGLCAYFRYSTDNGMLDRAATSSCGADAAD
ncbi:MATE family efflux transporter [Halorarum halophilum]|uniref:Multidrug-efflux transporter n=1 Tax=Halorarum halophilum TaxID=2743090 RepID=A0A7D5GFH6_9EURY|nr:MATE family efflux transporter [Halobaculum halophilum]QLG28248.1 MATE family efflux transporter [Halobaculum halophilum]